MDKAGRVIQEQLPSDTPLTSALPLVDALRLFTLQLFINIDGKLLDFFEYTHGI